jgi:hypothetical protein
MMPAGLTRLSKKGLDSLLVSTNSNDRSGQTTAPEPVEGSAISSFETALSSKASSWDRSGLLGLLPRLRWRGSCRAGMAGQHACGVLRGLRAPPRSVAPRQKSEHKSPSPHMVANRVQILPAFGGAPALRGRPPQHFWEKPAAPTTGGLGNAMMAVSASSASRQEINHQAPCRKDAKAP